MNESKESLLSSFIEVGQNQNQQKYLEFERLAELFTWLVVILSLFYIQLPIAHNIDKKTAYTISFGVALFSLFWHRLLPKKLIGRTKEFIYTLLFTVFLSLLIHNSGSLQSQLIFFYYLLILRTSMSLPIYHTIFEVIFTIILIFGEAFTAGSSLQSLSLALLYSWALFLVAIFGRFNATEATIEKRIKEETLLEKEKDIGKLKDEFVLILSRNLMQPAKASKGYVDSIVAKYANSLKNDSLELLKLAGMNNERLILQLNDLLDVSRIGQGSLNVKLTDVSIKPIINDVLSTLFFDARAKKISLLQRGDPDLAAKADPDRLKEVLSNLIGNAIKYTNDGGQVVISVNEEGDYANISVSDNGIGISTEDQKHLFQQFFRVENEKTKTIKGSGLGLFITKNLVEKMGGQVGVTSQVGKGSSFYFTLPRFRW